MQQLNLPLSTYHGYNTPQHQQQFYQHDFEYGEIGHGVLSPVTNRPGASGGGGHGLNQPKRPSSGMHQIFLEAKLKIKQLKEESKLIMRNTSPKCIIENNRAAAVLQSRNGVNVLHSSVSAIQPSGTVKNPSWYSTINSNNNSQTSHKQHQLIPPSIHMSASHQQPPSRLLQQQENRYFDKREYDRLVSQRRKAKIHTLKNQLQTMLMQNAQASQASSSQQQHKGNNGDTGAMMMVLSTPDKRRNPCKDTEYYNETTKRSQLSSITNSNKGGSDFKMYQTHSALKSRTVHLQNSAKAEKKTVFQLVNTAPTLSPVRTGSLKLSDGGGGEPFSLSGQGHAGAGHGGGHGGTVRSIHQTQSNFSIYSYSITEDHYSQRDIEYQQQIPATTASIATPPQFLVNKIETQMEGEPSITFISSKFIKSNSVESIPELQIVHQQQMPYPSHRGVGGTLLSHEDSAKTMNTLIQQDQMLLGDSQGVGGVASCGLFQSVANNHPYKKRTKSAQRVLTDDQNLNRQQLQQLDSSSSTVQRQTFQVVPNPQIRKTAAEASVSICDVLKKEDILKAQSTLQSIGDEQLKQLPVLYVNELRRLARTINRIFGESAMKQ